MIDFLAMFHPVATGEPDELLPFLTTLPAYTLAAPQNASTGPGYTPESITGPWCTLVALHKGSVHQAPLHADTSHFAAIYGYAVYRAGTPGARLHRGPITAQHLIDAYQTHGSDLPQLLRGSYVAMIHDTHTGRTIFFNDPLNVRQWYHATLPGGRLVVSSSVAALCAVMRANGRTTRLNRVAMAEYLLLGYPLGECTLVEGIESFRAGVLSTYLAGNLNHTTTYSVAKSLLPERPTLGFRASVEHLDEVLHHTITGYVSDWKRTAVALTGGYDSRTVLAALGPARASEVHTYSYGHEGSFDLEIPEKLAAKTGLKYKAMLLGPEFYEQYTELATDTLAFGEGTAELSRGNYLYAFRQMALRYDWILTGLFGSEFIKPITSEGSFINRLGRTLLDAPDWRVPLRAAFTELEQMGLLQPGVLQQALPGMEYDLESLPSLSPALKGAGAAPQRLFHFLATEGIRKYFMKELKIERSLVQNLHPFFDIQWLEALVQTPFTWLHNYVEGKSMLASLKTHRVYGELIRRNFPALGHHLSTHGYRPMHLRSPVFYPLIALEYRQHKDRIGAATGYRLHEPVMAAYHHFEDRLGNLGSVFNNTNLAALAQQDFGLFNRVASMQIWLTMHGIEA